jgi:hypothetical protein
MCWPNQPHASDDSDCNLNICWPNLSQASEDTKCISRCVDQTHHMLEKTQKVSQIVLTKPLPHASKATKCIWTFVDQTYTIQSRTQNESQLLWSKSISYQREHKMHLNNCWPVPYPASEYIKCVWTCFDQTPHMPARTQKVSKHVLTKPLLCQRGHKMQPNLCWPKLSHASDDTKCISICVDENHSMPART